MAKTKYAAEQVQKLQDMEAIRRNPGMYIGDKRGYGLLQIVWEIVSNAVDEASAGFGKQVEVDLLKNGSVRITDYGRGIPVEWKADEELSALSLVFLKLHAGGKFEASDSAYGTSGGMHGVGGKAANAMSAWLEVEVRRHGLRFKQRFEDGGVPAYPVKIYDASRQEIGEIDPDTVLKLSKDDIAQSVNGKNVKTYADTSTGTVVTFLPQRDFFDWTEMGWDSPQSPPWDVECLRERLAQMSFLQPGVKFNLTDERPEETTTETFYSKDGLVGYLDWLRGEVEPLHKPLHFQEDVAVELPGSGKKSQVTVEVAMQYTKSDRGQMVSFVNTIPTRSGGKHVSAFQAALTKAVKAFADEKRLLKKGDDIRGDDVLLGLYAIVNISMSHTPQFLGQTKESLSSPEVHGPVFSTTYDAVTAYLGKNVSTGRLVVNQAKAAAHGRAAAVAARQHIIAKSSGSLDDVGAELAIKKLADIQRRNGVPLVPVEHTALFIVEGDSAGGSCKLGRTGTHHAILALRGKITNVWRKRPADIFKIEDVSAILRAIGGVNGDGTFDPDAMRYGRIVITVDADDDGAHIACLLMTLFWKIRPELIMAGRLYLARPPLYQVRSKKKKDAAYAYDDVERDALIKKMGGIQAVTIQRYKGLGEMSADQMAETILCLPEGDPDELTLEDFAAHEVRITVVDAEAATEMIERLMGRDSSARRTWLMETRWEVENV